MISLNYINELITLSESLLEQESLPNNEYRHFKNQSEAYFSYLISSDIDSVISDLAKMGLYFKVRRIKNPFFRRLFFFATKARDNITFNAPYLKGHTESDYNKQYVFWIKKCLEGILFNLKRLGFLTEKKG